MLAQVSVCLVQFIIEEFIMLVRFFSIIVLSLCAFAAQAQSVAIGLSGPGYALSLGSGGHVSARVAAPFTHYRSSQRYEQVRIGGGPGYSRFDHSESRGGHHGNHGMRGMHGQRGWNQGGYSHRGYGGSGHHGRRNHHGW